MPEDNERHITTKHTDYADYEDQWEKIRHVVEGEEKVKDEGEEYLPKLGGQTDADYDAYKDRALFYNATGRTVEALTGMVFRKPPKIKVPENLEEIEDDLSLQDETAKGFGKRLVRENIETGHCGILVDFPRVEKSATTQAEARRNGEFPFLTLYVAEEIRNWHVRRENGNTELRALILHEEFENQEGYFGFDTEEQYRLLQINEDGVYEQKVWRRSAEDDSEGGWFLADHIIPRMGGEPMDTIPFFFCGVTDTTSEVSKPPLIDLANANLSHYTLSADWRHGLHWTALPTPAVTGGDPDELTISIGPQAAIVLENPDAEIKMLEFEGKGLSEIVKALDKVEDMMADLGARLVMDQSHPSDATETIHLKQQGQNSVLSNIADTCGAAYQAALNVAAKWKSGGAMDEPEADVQFNKDFFPRPMSPQMLRELLKGVQGGQLSFETFFEQLKQGELVSENRTVEEERDAIEAEGPSLAEL